MKWVLWNHNDNIAHHLFMQKCCFTVCALYIILFFFVYLLLLFITLMLNWLCMTYLTIGPFFSSHALIFLNTADDSLSWLLYVQEFDLNAFDIMVAAGVYLIRHLPMAAFREGYLATMREIVGGQQLEDRQEEMNELFARTLSSKVTAGFIFCFAYHHSVVVFCFGFCSVNPLTLELKFFETLPNGRKCTFTWPKYTHSSPKYINIVRLCVGLDISQG